MNILRTIPQTETQRWVDLLFQPGPPKSEKDPEPLTYPVSRTLSQDVTGGFLYVTYQGQIIGYGKIASVKPHLGDTVGEDDQPVSAGDMILLESPLVKMPFPLDCPGFRGYRYVKANLHELSQQEAQAALVR